MADLASAQAKARRAAERAQQVGQIVREWSADVEWERAVADNGQKILVLARLREKPPLMDWQLEISDVVANLRDALDHAIFADACAHHQTDEPSHAGQLAFPITDDEERWDKARARSLKGLPRDVLTTVRQVQPWVTGRLGLIWLREISNKTKHRSLDLLSMARPRTSAEITVANIGGSIGPLVVPGAPIGTDDWTIVGGVMADYVLPTDYEVRVETKIVHVWHDLHRGLGQDRPEFFEALNALGKEAFFVLRKLREVART